MVWWHPIDDWLAAFARALYDQAPFRLAMIGLEASAFTRKPMVEVPSNRYLGYVVPSGNFVTYYPATNTRCFEGTSILQVRGDSSGAPSASSIAVAGRSGYPDPVAHAYELALELGDRDDTRLEAALLSMWSAAGIEGCSAEHEPVPLSLSSLLQFGRLDGSLILPTGKPLVCFVTVVRLGDAETSSEEQLASLEGAASDYAPDWLELCLPMDALAEIDSRVGHYPFGFIDDPDPSEWTRPLDDWLAKIGIQIYATATFRLGLVGYDAVMEDGSGSMANGIPRERINGYLWPNASGVGYYPANAGDWWWRHGPGAQFKKFRSAGNRALWRFRSTVHIHLDQLEHRLEDWLSRYRERSQ